MKNRCSQITDCSTGPDFSGLKTMKLIRNANGPLDQIFSKSANKWPNYQRSMRGTGFHYLNLIASMMNMGHWILKTTDFLNQIF